MFKKAHDNLHQWYKVNGRHELPWRGIDNAYFIWVSEIMLQQTQVKTVLKRFYYPFLEAFPRLQDLANASEEEVLKKWEGLGYYTRARNLHKTAILCQKKLPKSEEELIKLPGIGKSTAHAIASFAYKASLPILDANVKRILYRIFAIKTCSDKELWEKAYQFLDRQRPYDFNQALMDLGSSLCKGKEALCEGCPFELICEGKQSPLQYPQKKIKKTIPIRKRHIVIHHFDGKYALNKRETRFLNGLWGFHEYMDEKKSKHAIDLGRIKHSYSHFKLQAKVYLYSEFIDDSQWFSLAEIKALPLSTADHKALALLEVANHTHFNGVNDLKNR